MSQKTRRRVLVTGGAGFVGSHTVDLLVAQGASEITVVDSLDPQIHGKAQRVPEYLQPHITSQNIRFIRGDVRDAALMKPLVLASDAIVHLAAAVGVGQSMYMPRHFCDVNVVGTATLMDILANDKHTVRKVIVASSMSLYGEGSYRCEKCGDIVPEERSVAQLQAHEWEPKCARCGAVAIACGTPESKKLHATSIYALTKKFQEESLLLFGANYHLPVIALRYFNIYGSRQSLSNPYTGVAAIFLSRLLNKQSPTVFEDGGQSRDFVHVTDVARANVLALDAELEGEHVLNVGTGDATTVAQIGTRLAAALKLDIPLTIENKFRAGDIRHCIADITAITKALGFAPKMSLDDGFAELIAWTLKSERPTDEFAASLAELHARNLIR